MSIQDNAILSPALAAIFDRVRESADFMPLWQVCSMQYEPLLTVVISIPYIPSYFLIFIAFPQLTYLSYFFIFIIFINFLIFYNNSTIRNPHVPSYFITFHQIFSCFLIFHQFSSQYYFVLHLNDFMGLQASFRLSALNLSLFLFFLFCNYTSHSPSLIYTNYKI